LASNWPSWPGEHPAILDGLGDFGGRGGGDVPLLGQMERSRTLQGVVLDLRGIDAAEGAELEADAS
jgi:hypothetical protein